MSSTTSSGFSDASSKAARMRGTLASHADRPWLAATAVDIVDIWVNLVTEQSRRSSSSASRGLREHPRLPREQPGTARRRRAARADGRARRRDRHLHRWPRPQHRQAARRSATRTPADSSSPAASAIRRGPGRSVRAHPRARAAPALRMVRVMPLASQVPTNDARHYPVYQVCEELGIPVGINAGIPGPRVRSQRAAPRAARGRADRLPRSRRDRRAHGASRTKSCS